MTTSYLLTAGNRGITRARQLRTRYLRDIELHLHRVPREILDVLEERTCLGLVLPGPLALVQRYAVSRKGTLEDPVADNTSWQLPANLIFVIAAAEAAFMRSQSAAAPQLPWAATGTLDHQGAIGPVTGIAKKLMAFLDAIVESGTDGVIGRLVIPAQEGKTCELDLPPADPLLGPLLVEKTMDRHWRCALRDPLAFRQRWVEVFAARTLLEAAIWLCGTSERELLCLLRDLATWSSQARVAGILDGARSVCRENAPTWLFGKEHLIAAARSHLLGQDDRPRAVLIRARGGVGKSVLLAAIAQGLSKVEGACSPPYLVFAASKTPADELCRQLWGWGWPEWVQEQARGQVPWWQLRDRQQVFLVVDALDQILDASEGDQLIAFFEAIYSLPQGNSTPLARGIGLVISSRDDIVADRVEGALRARGVDLLPLVLPADQEAAIQLQLALRGKAIGRALAVRRAARCQGVMRSLLYPWKQLRQEVRERWTREERRIGAALAARGRPLGKAGLRGFGVRKAVQELPHLQAHLADYRTADLSRSPMVVSALLRLCPGEVRRYWRHVLISGGRDRQAVIDLLGALSGKQKLRKRRLLEVAELLQVGHERSAETDWLPADLLSSLRPSRRSARTISIMLAAGGVHAEIGRLWAMALAAQLPSRLPQLIGLAARAPHRDADGKKSTPEPQAVHRAWETDPQLLAAACHAYRRLEEAEPDDREAQKAKLLLADFLGMILRSRGRERSGAVLAAEIGASLEHFWKIVLLALRTKGGEGPLRPDYEIAVRAFLSLSGQRFLTCCGQRIVRKKLEVNVSSPFVFMSSFLWRFASPEFFSSLRQLILVMGEHPQEVGHRSLAENAAQAQQATRDKESSSSRSSYYQGFRRFYRLLWPVINLSDPFCLSARLWLQDPSSSATLALRLPELLYSATGIRIDAPEIWETTLPSNLGLVLALLLSSLVKRAFLSLDGGDLDDVTGLSPSTRQGVLAALRGFCRPVPWKEQAKSILYPCYAADSTFAWYTCSLCMVRASRDREGWSSTASTLESFRQEVARSFPDKQRQRVLAHLVRTTLHILRNTEDVEVINGVRSWCIQVLREEEDLGTFAPFLEAPVIVADWRLRRLTLREGDDTSRLLAALHQGNRPGLAALTALAPLILLEPEETLALWQRLFDQATPGRERTLLLRCLRGLADLSWGPCHDAIYRGGHGFSRLAAPLLEEVRRCCRRPRPFGNRLGEKAMILALHETVVLASLNWPGLMDLVASCFGEKVLAGESFFSMLVATFSAASERMVQEQGTAWLVHPENGSTPPDSNQPSIITKLPPVATRRELH